MAPSRSQTPQSAHGMDIDHPLPFHNEEPLEEEDQDQEQEPDPREDPLPKEEEEQDPDPGEDPPDPEYGRHEQTGAPRKAKLPMLKRAQEYVACIAKARRACPASASRP